MSKREPKKFSSASAKQSRLSTYALNRLQLSLGSTRPGSEGPQGPPPPPPPPLQDPPPPQGLQGPYGRNSAITYHGLKKDVVSSGMQKTGVRRGEQAAGEWYLLEWILLRTWDNPHAKGLMTNLKNRLCEIIPVEDVLAFAQPALLLAIRDRVKRWDTADRSVEAGRYLLQVLQWLRVARKGRIGSDLRASGLRAAMTPNVMGAAGDTQVATTTPAHLAIPVAAAAGNAEDSIEDESSVMAARKPHVMAARKPHVMAARKPPAPAEALAAVQTFFQWSKEMDTKLQAGSAATAELTAAMNAVFALLSRFNPMVLSKKKTIKAGGAWKEEPPVIAICRKGKTAEYLLWDELFLRAKACIAEKPLMEPFVTDMWSLYHEHKERPERFLYLVHACLAYLYRNQPDIDWSIASRDAFLKQEPLTAEAFLERIRLHRASAKIDVADYVIDMHTADGRQAGKNGLDFATEGSLIVGEDAQYLHPPLRAIYHQLKGVGAGSSGPASKPPTPEAGVIAPADAVHTIPTATPSFFQRFARNASKSTKARKSYKEASSSECEDDDEWIDTGAESDAMADEAVSSESEEESAKPKKKRARKAPTQAASSSSSAAAVAAPTSSGGFGGQSPPEGRSPPGGRSPPPAVILGATVAIARMAQLPCGSKSPTWLVCMDDPVFVESGRPTRMLFVRPLPLERRHQQWDFPMPLVDQIKTKLGLISAESVVDGPWLVARDLGTVPAATVAAHVATFQAPFPFYPTMIRNGIEVVDKLQTDVASISWEKEERPELLKNASLWPSLWTVLLWRAVLGCRDTNLSNILWSRSRQQCISVDEMFSVDTDKQHTLTGVQCLFAQGISAAFRNMLLQSLDRAACTTQVTAWRGILRREKQACTEEENNTPSTANNKQQAIALYERMISNADWLLQRIAASFA